MLGLEEKTLLSVDKCPAQGINYHITEVYFEELKLNLPIKLENFKVLLKPFFSMMGKSHDKVLLNKIKTYMLGRLVEHGNGYLETKKEGDSDVKSFVKLEVYGAATLKLGFSMKFFELGSSSNFLQGNRKVLFSLHDDFPKLEKGPEVDENGKMDEVPDLVPNIDMVSEVNTEGSNGSDGKGSKKTKKGKKASGETKSSKKKKNEITDLNALEVKEEMIGNGFEKVAAEVGMDVDGRSSFSVNENSDVGKIRGTSVTKVRFQMNNNLVWKPHNPLPPQSVRVPPSTTPRGSAFEKGVSAGPVREMPKKAKLRSDSTKTTQMNPRIITPTIKRLKKMRPASA
ncbi:hypothetical protein GIB67_022935 [Kingdonia uniflora]|uniref:Uncharacterized protein n=1 Tax=Kingdonia uniflora TaxID=39325 RepID=A0A7J7P2A0_9MAGN|nr:hypothetical protein GIB67_022935 [Kingdonia uniflora]